MLLIDTCGERGSIAIFQDHIFISEVTLPERAASAHVLGGVREALKMAGLSWAALTELGVVTGPGSFTGIRVGVAVAKGLAESTGLRVGSASRLAVLWESGSYAQGLAVLRAGREEVYVLEVSASGSRRELLIDTQSFAHLSSGRYVMYAEACLAPLLKQAEHTTHSEITARDAFRIVSKDLERGGTDLQSLDGNYVRDEGAIYRQMPVRA